MQFIPKTKARNRFEVNFLNRYLYGANLPFETQRMLCMHCWVIQHDAHRWNHDFVLIQALFGHRILSKMQLMATSYSQSCYTWNLLMSISQNKCHASAVLKRAAVLFIILQRNGALKDGILFCKQIQSKELLKPLIRNCLLYLEIRVNVLWIGISVVPFRSNDMY